MKKSKFQNPNFQIDLGEFLPGVRKNVLLKEYTTFRIGGPADFFYEAKSERNLIKAVRAARRLKIPFLVLGSGSNVLFSDHGWRGLIVRNSASGMRVVRNFKRPIEKKFSRIEARYHPANSKKYLRFDDLDYAPEPFDTELEVLAGTPLPQLIRWTLKNNLTGLQWFAGIPGSVGGAVVYNAHGGTKLFSDYVKDIAILDEKNKVRRIEKEKAGFAYDRSLFRKNSWTILRVNLFLARGNSPRANFVYREWFKRKLRAQPQKNCAGSVFKNFSLRTAQRVGAPTGSAGWFIDRCGLKGKMAGGAKISEKHANFIVNLGRARAEDVKNLIKLVKSEVKRKFGLNLREEIRILPEKF